MTKRGRPSKIEVELRAELVAEQQYSLRVRDELTKVRQTQDHREREEQIKILSVYGQVLQQVADALRPLSHFLAEGCWRRS